VTAIGTILQPGQPIPDDVTGVDDAMGDDWHLTPAGHWHCGEMGVRCCAEDKDCNLGLGELVAYAPLTVTAVRGQPADPESQQADASPLLNLVRQLMVERYSMGYNVARGRTAGAEHDQLTADALFARIAAFVPQQPVQADDSTGNLWWIHSCGDVAAEGRGEDYGPDACNACGMPGPWRPLLVAAPDGDRTPDAVDLGEALDDAVGDYEAARAKLLEVVGERDQARSEAERLRIKLNDVRDDRNRIVALGEHLRDQLRAEVAPPREPRTWKQIEHAPEGLRRVEVRQPDGRQFVAARRQDGHWVATIAHPDPENAELDETYTWGELLGEGDVTEVLDREAGP
jgi:hypothetical protein